MKKSCSTCKVEEKNTELLSDIAFLVAGTIFLIAGLVLNKLDPTYSSITWDYFKESAFFSSRSFVAFVLYTVGYLILFVKLIISFISEFKEGNHINEFLLMIIATLGAYGINEYPEALLVVLFGILGELLENYANSQSKKSIKKLVNNMPLLAHVVQEDGSIKDLDPSLVEVGQSMEIRPGEKLSIDGIIETGSGSMDLSSINGESLPKEVHQGDKVYSGSINLDTLLVIKTSKLYKDSTLTKIMNLVESEQSRKSSSEKFITRFSKFYTPLVIFIAFLVFIIGYGLNGFVWAGDNGGEEWLYKSLSILLVSCPCALLVSVPLAFFAGIGSASRFGVLIKGSNSLETIAKAKEFVFDKTGTLTKGEPILENQVDKEALKIAASLESKTSHPLGKAIVKANKEGVYPVEDFKNLIGYGISGRINNEEYLIGKKDLLIQNGIKDIEEPSTPYKVLYLAKKNDKQLAYFIVSDEIKETSKEALKDLKEEGVAENIMLSGDDKSIAQEVGNKVGCDASYGDLLPDEKLKKVQEYSKKGILCYVGDGINDSPAILAANVGVAMGALGSDAAIEASDIVILNDDLRKVAEAKRLAKKTMRVVYEGIALALGLKILVMILVTTGVLGNYAMIVSSLADTGVMAICTLYAMQMLLYKRKYRSK
jgi:Cd2+/Zn2+-exporting ATPase